MQIQSYSKAENCCQNDLLSVFILKKLLIQIQFSFPFKIIKM